MLSRITSNLFRSTVSTEAVFKPVSSLSFRAQSVFSSSHPKPLDTTAEKSTSSRSRVYTDPGRAKKLGEKAEAYLDSAEYEKASHLFKKAHACDPQNHSYKQLAEVSDLMNSGSYPTF